MGTSCSGWQLIEERIDDSWTSGFTKDRAMQYLWGARYIDDIVMHREDADGDGSFTDFSGGGALRWWHLTDVQFSTIVILDDAANTEERVRYDAYGRALHHEWRDVDGDRDYDSSDRTTISNIAAGANNSIGQSNYKVEADLNRDGVIDLTDVTLATTNYVSALPAGDLSNSTVKNTIGWDGYVFNPEDQSYKVRFRDYGTDIGRWRQRDPVGYVDGQNLYQVVMSRPIKYRDPTGLFCDDLCVGGSRRGYQVADVRLRPRLRAISPGTIDKAASLALQLADTDEDTCFLLTLRSTAKSIPGAVGIGQPTGQTGRFELFGSTRYNLTWRCERSTPPAPGTGASGIVSGIVGGVVTVCVRKAMLAPAPGMVEMILGMDKDLMRLEGAAIWIKITWDECQKECCCLLWKRYDWQDDAGEYWHKCSLRNSKPTDEGFNVDDPQSISNAIPQCVAEALAEAVQSDPANTDN